MNHKEEILKLKDGESYSSLQGGSGFEIWLKYDTYFLFEIALLDETPRYTEAYSRYQIDKLIAHFESWT